MGARRVTLALGAAAAMASGCGQAVDPGRPANHHPVDGPPYTRSEMIDELQLAPVVEDGTGRRLWRTPTHCTVTELLLTRGAIARHRDEMWLVATTPNEAAGVLLLDDASDECWNDLSARLQSLETFH
jgi:hypothetical protein